MVLACPVGIPAFAADSATSMVELADGVYQFLSPDIDGIAVDGNSIAILNERDVLVFDTNVLPSTAMAVLSDIRKLTAKPVRYAVNSHWHPDHWDGNELYARHFPDLEIIASETTRRLMQNTMKVYVKTLEFEMKGSNKEFADQLRTGKSAAGKKLSEADRKEIRSTLRAEQNFLAEYNHRQPVLPSLTFQRKLTLYHGGRVFQLLDIEPAPARLNISLRVGQAPRSAHTFERAAGGQRRRRLRHRPVGRGAPRADQGQLQAGL